MLNNTTVEMYFYLLPKGLLKRKFVNVYEVPIYWRYTYLRIEPHSKKEKQALEEYLATKTETQKVMNQILSDKFTKI